MTIELTRPAAMTFVEGEKSKRILFSRYDSTFPRVFYRNCLNLPGGGAEGHNSPLDVLKDEISQEFSLRPDLIQRIILSGKC